MQKRQLMGLRGSVVLDQYWECDAQVKAHDKAQLTVCAGIGTLALPVRPSHFEREQSR